MSGPEIARLEEGILSPFILNEEEGDFRANHKSSSTIQKQHI